MDSLVTTAWLETQLEGPGSADGLVVLDASMHLAETGRDARAEYLSGHIPAARFMDLARLVDPASPLENTLPGPGLFAQRMSALGVASGRRIVLYDDSDIRSAARGWFLFQLAETGNVAILDGGLPKWRAEGRRLDSGDVLAASAPDGAGWSPPGWNDALVRDKADMLANLATGAEQVVDARGRPRFAGTAPEPRAGVAPGHIPAARNVPYAALFEADGTFKDDAALRRLFAHEGVDLDRPVVATCGSGITACALAFALDRVGKDDVAVYDGSWAEWGADPATPKATGPA